MGDRDQFFAFCRRCGKQILMTYNQRKGKWIPCDPEIKRFRRAGGPETFVTPEGETCYGVRAVDGEFGYLRHRRDCV